MRAHSLWRDLATLCRTATQIHAVCTGLARCAPESADLKNGFPTNDLVRARLRRAYLHSQGSALPALCAATPLFFDATPHILLQATQRIYGEYEQALATTVEPSARAQVVTLVSQWLPVCAQAALDAPAVTAAQLHLLLAKFCATTDTLHFSKLLGAAASPAVDPHPLP